MHIYIYKYFSHSRLQTHKLVHFSLLTFPSQMVKERVKFVACVIYLMTSALFICLGILVMS